MSADYAPGHYDGDGCRFPAPGHIVTAQDDEPRAALRDEIARRLWKHLRPTSPDAAWDDGRVQKAMWLPAADALLPLLAAREAAAHAAGRAEGLRDAEQAVRALGPDIENLLATAREVVDEHNRNPGEEPCCGSCESAPELAREVLRLHEPTDATVERVARALYEHQYREDRYSPLGTWAMRSTAWKRQWLDEARAALRALSSATPSAPEGTPTDG